MRTNFFSFAKLQVYALSQIVWLQLLGIVLFPLFFNQLNADKDLPNVVILAAGLLMLSYLLLRNYAFNDAKYKTKLLFCILPVTPSAIIGARGLILYLFTVIAAPLVLFFSTLTNALRPELFAVIKPHILPYGLCLVAIFIPIQFLIFHFFEAQKADIIAALACFPYMGLMALLYHYFMKSFLWIVVIMIAVFTNVVCFKLSARLYKSRL